MGLSRWCHGILPHDDISKCANFVTRMRYSPSVGLPHAVQLPARIWTTIGSVVQQDNVKIQLQAQNSNAPDTIKI